MNTEKLSVAQWLAAMTTFLVSAVVGASIVWSILTWR